MSRVAVLVLSVAALVLVTVGTALAGTMPPPGYAVAHRQTIYPGIEYQEITKPAGPVLAHVAHIAPGAAVDARVISAHDKIPTRSTDLETTSSMCRRVGCVVAVNGDFHVLGQPMGGVVIGGRMLRSPDPSRAQLWVDDGGHLGAGPFPWSAALRLSDGSQLRIGGVNVPGAAGPVLYTSAWGPSTPPSGGIELVLAPAEALGPLNRPVPATLQGVRLSPGGIPAGGAVIAVPASAADQLNSVWARVQQGVVSAHADVVVETPVNAVDSVGTTPVILHGGQPDLPWPDDPNLVGAIQPRTIVGWNAAGDVYFVVVDGRQPSSVGLTMAQAADLLTGLGATEAANLDGGGGSTLVVGGTVWNQPSDAPAEDPALAERVASNALVLLPRVGGPPAPKLPPRPGTGSDPGSGSATPPTGGGSTGPHPSAPSDGGGSSSVLGPAPGSGLTPLPAGGPLLAATPVDPGSAGETAVGGLPLAGVSAPVPGLPGVWNIASAPGGGRLLRLLGATGGTPVGFLSADAGGAGPGADGWPVASGSSGAVAARWSPDREAGRTGMSGPLMAFVRAGALRAPAGPRGSMAGGVITAEWLFFAAVWSGRRIRRNKLSSGGAGRR